MKSPKRPQGEYDFDPRLELYDNEESAGVDVRGIINTLLRHQFKILIVLLAALAIAWFNLSNITPLYTARVELVIEDQKAPVDLGELLGGGNSAANKEIQNELRVIKSRPLMATVIDDLDLLRDVEFNSTAGLKERPAWAKFLAQYDLWPINIDYSTMPPKVEMGVPPVPPELRLGDQRLRSAIDRLSAKVMTGVIPGTTVVWISAKAWTPEKAARIANAIAEAYLDERNRAKADAQRNASEFIGEQVVDLREEVEVAEAAVQAFRAENAIIDGENNNDVIAFEDLRNRAEAAQTLQRTRADQLERLDRTLAAGGGLGNAAKILGDSRISALVNAGLLERAREEIETSRTQLQTDLRLASGRANALAGSLTDVESDLQKGSANLVRLRQLEREAAASKILFETFLARQKETAAQQQLVSTDARVLNAAEAPYSPSSPNVARTYLLHLIIGALIASGLIFLFERSRNRFITPEELEATTGLTVLGAIPRYNRSRKRPDVLKHIREEPGSSIAEAVRDLRTSILLANVDEPPKVVVVTSSVPAEGKSITTLMLASVTAQMGVRTLIVDGDLRRHTLHKTLGVKASPGLISVLNGKVPFDEAVRIDEKSGLHALTVENTKASAPDILSSHAFENFLKEARSRYDLVLIDAPPVLPVTDARILAKMADALVYAVKWNDTPKEIVKNGLESLANLGIRINGLMMTQIDREKQKKYGYGYYGYGNYKYYKKAQAYYTS